MSPYERHLQRLEVDPAYRAGFEHGRNGGTTDANPWPHNVDEHAAWNKGWQVGSVFRSFDEAGVEIEHELQRLVDVGELEF